MVHQAPVRVGVLGGTGRTGHRTVARLLGAGYLVRVLARHAPRDHERHPLPQAVEVVWGDALEYEALERFSAGLDVVVCTLGPDEDSPPDLCSRATDLLVRAMRKEGVERLIVLTGAIVGNEHLGVVYRFLGSLKSVQHALADRRKQERIVRASGLEWTLIRPPRLSRDIDRGHAEVTSEVIRLFDHVSRSEVAEAIVQAVKGNWKRHSIALVHRHGAGQNSNPEAQHE